MFKGFKDFLMRGNVIDLAVAVVVGAAFTAIVTAFTTNIIQPLVNSIGGTDTAQGLGFTIRSGNPETFVDVGALITAAINFLIVAAVVYFVIVMPYEKLKKLAARHGDDAAAQTESELLTEIRDILQGKDPDEEKAKISESTSEKDQALIERHADDNRSAEPRPDGGPQFSGSGPLSRGPLSGTPTQFLTTPPVDASGPPPGYAPSGPPPSGPSPQQGPPAGGPPPGYAPSGPPPGYTAPPRPNPPQYGPPSTGPQGPGPGYRPDPLTGPPPGSYGPPPDRPDGGGRHSQ
jgi:large conductance mechanosensitive channel